MSEEDSTPLWFLLRNPRALDEVETWLKQKRKEKASHNHTMSCCAVDFIDELLADIKRQEEINFPTLGKKKMIKNDE